MAVSLSLSSSLSFLNSVRSSSLSSTTALTSNFGPKNARFLKIEANARTRREDRIARHERIRKKVHGTPERPRLCVYRSNKHLFVQVIDDTKMHTLASASTMQKSLVEEIQCTSGPTITCWLERLDRELQAMKPLAIEISVFTDCVLCV